MLIIAKILREFVKSKGDPMKQTVEESLKKEFCGAKTRAGTPCKRRDLYENGRCRLHGGLSTGPKTKAGKKKSALNGFKKRTSMQMKLSKLQKFILVEAYQHDEIQNADILIHYWYGFQPVSHGEIKFSREQIGMKK